jgi:hypothetical protein
MLPLGLAFKRGFQPLIIAVLVAVSTSPPTTWSPIGP